MGRTAVIMIIESMLFLFNSAEGVLPVYPTVVTCVVSLYQMFIGHSQPIRQVSFTPDQLGVVSVGDAIFLWDFLAHPADSDSW